MRTKITRNLILACLLLFVAPVLVLTGCGRGGNMNGTYTFQSVVIDGNTLTTFDAIRGAMLGYFEPQEGSDRNDAIFELSNFISFQIIDEMDEDPAFVELRPVLSSNWRATLTALVVSVTFAVEHEEIPDDWTEFAEELVTRIEDVFCSDEYSYDPEELVGLVERVVLGLFDATTPSETVDEFLKIAPRLQVIGLLPGELSFKIIEGLDDKAGYSAFLEHGEVWTIVDSAVTASVLEDLWIAMIIDLNGTLDQTMAGFLAKPIRDRIMQGIQDNDVPGSYPNLQTDIATILGTEKISVVINRLLDDDTFVTSIEEFIRSELLGQKWVIQGKQVTRTIAREGKADDVISSQFVYQNNKFVIEDIVVDATFSSGTISITMGDMVLNLKR
jgi:hypothetical protein